MDGIIVLITSCSGHDPASAALLITAESGNGDFSDFQGRSQEISRRRESHEPFSVMHLL